MRNLKSRFLVILGACVLLLALFTGGSAVAFADSGTNATAVVTGGNLSEQGPSGGVGASAVTLNGADQTTSYALPLAVIDARGNGGGWNLTITSTQFTTGGANPQTLPTSASTIAAAPAVSCTAGSTCTAPVNSVSYSPLVVPAGATAPNAVKFFSAAAGSGLGSFTITPTISVLIPANAYAGSYSSSVSVAVVSGP